MHPDAKVAILSIMIITISWAGLASLCYFTYGTMFFSGMVVLTIGNMIILKKYVFR